MNPEDSHLCWIRVGGLEGITYSVDKCVASEYGYFLEQIENGNGNVKENPIECVIMFTRNALLRYSQLWRGYQESNNDEMIRSFLARITDTNLINVQDLLTFLNHPIKRAVIRELEIRNKIKMDDKSAKEKEKLSAVNETLQHMSSSSTAKGWPVSYDVGPSNELQERLGRKFAEREKVASSKVNSSRSSHAKQDKIENFGDGRDVASKSVFDSRSAVGVASTSTRVVSSKSKKKREKKRRDKEKDATLEEISSHSSSTFEVCAEPPKDAHHMTSSYLGKKVLLLLRDGRRLLGILRSFDQLANSVLEGACERVIVGDLYCDISLSLYVIPGENVVLIGELELEKEELPPYMARVAEAEIKKAQKLEREATILKGASAIAEDRFIDDATYEESWIVEDGDLEDIPDPDGDLKDIPDPDGDLEDIPDPDGNLEDIPDPDGDLEDIPNPDGDLEDIPDLDGNSEDNLDPEFDRILDVFAWRLQASRAERLGDTEIISLFRRTQ